MGTRIGWISSTMLKQEPIELPPGESQWVVQLPRLPLAAGSYGLTIHCIALGECADALRVSDAFEVSGSDVYGVVREYPPNQGYFLMKYEMDVRAATTKEGS
jgi:hypothetical protein